jgi:hypothetical protein
VPLPLPLPVPAHQEGSVSRSETPVLLQRRADTPSGWDRFLLLKDQAGAVSGGFHRGNRLDAERASRLELAHPWLEHSPGGEAA